MDAKSLSTQNLRIIRIVIGSLLLGCVGMILYTWQSTTWQEATSIFGVALMISGASLLSGGLLGFLFGIPRRLQRSDDSDENVKKAEDMLSNNMEREASYGANTNLEQISDWLTKILVGVGLTQISSLPEALQNYAGYASPGLGNFPGNEAFALALLIYYLIGGFLIGYLWTRLALAPALRQADIAALGGKLAEVEGKLSELEKQNAIDAIAETNAEESEDETLKERHDIPMLDYEALPMDTLVSELKNLVTNEKVMSIKEHVEEIRKAFLAKYNHLIEEKREEFNQENQDPNEEFQYHSPLKSKFDQYYTIFKDNKNVHFKSLQSNLKIGRAHV